MIESEVESIEPARRTLRTQEEQHVTPGNETPGVRPGRRLAAWLRRRPLRSVAGYGIIWVSADVLAESSRRMTGELDGQDS